MQNNIKVRSAKFEDLAEVIEMLGDLTTFQGQNPDATITVDGLANACGLALTKSSQRPDMAILVAEDLNTNNNTDHRLAGSVLIIQGYSARSGKTLKMRKVFVRESYRSAGVGRAIFRGLAEYARSHGLRHQENHVLTWNHQAVNFYRKMGMVDLYESDNLHLFQFDLK